MDQATEKLCPSCGTPLACRLQNFSIGADGSGLMTLFAAHYEVDLYACPQCGKVELYTAGFPSSPPSAQQPARPAPYWCEHCGKPSDERTCPDCNRVCISMGDHQWNLLLQARTRLSEEPSDDPLRTSQQKQEKPPWEK